MFANLDSYRSTYNLYRPRVRVFSIETVVLKGVYVFLCCWNYVGINLRINERLNFLIHPGWSKLIPSLKQLFKRFNKANVIC